MDAATVDKVKATIDLLDYTYAVKLTANPDSKEQLHHWYDAELFKVLGVRRGHLAPATVTKGVSATQARERSERVVKRVVVRQDKPAGPRNDCEYCGEPIEASGKRGRPRTMHEDCRAEWKRDMAEASEEAMRKPKLPGPMFGQ